MKRLSCFVLLGTGVALAVGCVPDGVGSSSSDCSVMSCESGVSASLGPLATRYAASMPLAIRVCFDASCDDVTLSGPPSAPTCAGRPGGAPDQLTSCNVHKGNVVMDVVRIDGADYANGGEHTFGVSVRDKTGVHVFSDVRNVRLAKVAPNGDACGPVCGVSHIDFGAPSATAVSGGSAGGGGAPDSGATKPGTPGGASGAMPGAAGAASAAGGANSTDAGAGGGGTTSAGGGSTTGAGGGGTTSAGGGGTTSAGGGSTTGAGGGGTRSAGGGGTTSAGGGGTTGAGGSGTTSGRGGSGGGP